MHNGKAGVVEVIIVRAVVGVVIVVVVVAVVIVVIDIGVVVFTVKAGVPVVSFSDVLVVEITVGRTTEYCLVITGF